MLCAFFRRERQRRRSISACAGAGPRPKAGEIVPSFFAFLRRNRRILNSGLRKEVRMKSLVATVFSVGLLLPLASVFSTAQNSDPSQQSQRPSDRNAGPSPQLSSPPSTNRRNNQTQGPLF